MGWWILAQQPPADPDADPMSWVNAIGLAALLVVYIADKLMAYLKSRGIDLHDISNKIDDLHTWYNNTTESGVAKKVSDLHAWHNHDDPDQAGVKIWWNQKYQSEIIKELAKIQRSQTDLLREMHREQQTTTQIQQEQVRLLGKLARNQDELARNVQEIQNKLKETT